MRLKQHEESALKVAHWLKEQPQVGLVLHPALPDCPGHEFWKRDFKGSSGLFSFELKNADDAARDAFVDRLSCSELGTAGAATKASRPRSILTAPSPHRPRRTSCACTSGSRMRTT